MAKSNQECGRNRFRGELGEINLYQNLEKEGKTYNVFTMRRRDT